MAKVNYDKMTREELEAESTRLATERTAIREQQVEVNTRLDALRALDTAGLSPEQIKIISRSAAIGATGEASEAVQ